MGTTIDAADLTKVCGLIDQRHEETVQTICRLVEIESPSGDVAGSQAIAEVLERAARAIPSVTSVERIAAPNYGEHLLIRFFAEQRNGHQATLVLGHTDTVHPRGTLSQEGVHTDGVRLFGPGIFDMKASCAMAIEALRCLTAAAKPPARPVTVLLTCDEEIGDRKSTRLNSSHVSES